MKYKLKLKQNLPFSNCPTLVDLDDLKILCNDVNIPEHIEHSYNPHNVRMFVIGHTFGAVCSAFASCEQDALNTAVDANLMDWCLSETKDYDDENLTPLGNASELFDLGEVWLGEVEFDAARDIELIAALVRASEKGNATL